MDKIKIIFHDFVTSFERGLTVGRFHEVGELAEIASRDVDHVFLTQRLLLPLCSSCGDIFSFLLQGGGRAFRHGWVFILVLRLILVHCVLIGRLRCNCRAFLIDWVLYRRDVLVVLVLVKIWVGILAIKRRRWLIANTELLHPLLQPLFFSLLLLLL